MISPRLNRSAAPIGDKADRVRLGSLPPRYSFVLNPYARERFTRCPKCGAPTRVRKLPLVVHIDEPGTQSLALLNKTCRLCLVCEMLIVDRAELDRVVTAAGLSRVPAPRYVVLGTIERRIWRKGLVGGVALEEIREHMADFKKYLKLEVAPAHWERSPSGRV